MFSSMALANASLICTTRHFDTHRRAVQCSARCRARHIAHTDWPLALSLCCTRQPLTWVIKVDKSTQRHEPATSRQLHNTWMEAILPLQICSKSVRHFADRRHAVADHGPPGSSLSPLSTRFKILSSSSLIAPRNL
jgi:hypothetical protein